jgi:hypothetical protein
MTDYEAAKVTELRQLAKDQGLKYSGLKKNALVKLLQANEGNVSTATGEGDSSGHCATDTAVKNGDAGQASGTDSQIASATATGISSSWHNASLILICRSEIARTASQHV